MSAHVRLIPFYFFLLTLLALAVMVPIYKPEATSIVMSLVAIATVAMTIILESGIRRRRNLFPGARKLDAVAYGAGVIGSFFLVFAMVVKAREDLATPPDYLLSGLVFDLFGVSLVFIAMAVIPLVMITRPLKKANPT